LTDEDPEEIAWFWLCVDHPNTKFHSNPFHNFEEEMQTDLICFICTNFMYFL